MNISKKAMLAGGVIVALLIAVAVLITLLLSERDNAAVIVPGSASPGASISALPSASASVGPTVLVDDNFTPLNIPESSLTYGLSNACFDSSGRLYLYAHCGAGLPYPASPVARTLDNNARLLDTDTWDLSVMMTPLADQGYDDNNRFVLMGSSRNDPNVGNDNIGIGTQGGGWALLVPGLGGDLKTIVLGETYMMGSTYHLTLHVAPDPAQPDHYLVTYRVANVVRAKEIELVAGQRSVEQPFGFQISARYDQLMLTGGDEGTIFGDTATKYDAVRVTHDQ